MGIEVSEKRTHLQVRSFERIIAGYEGLRVPFARYLAQFFKENKQMGSKDRRNASRLCYNYFRLGHAYAEEARLERLIFAEYLCESSSDVVSIYKPELLDSIGLPLEEKVQILQDSFNFNINSVNQFVDDISATINREAYLINQFQQPDLFIRLKKSAAQRVKTYLQAEGLNYREVDELTLALKNGTSLQAHKPIEGLYEVQDLCSQQTISFMQARPQENWWDACAASGGKALLFLDHFPKVNLLVSDVRLSILRNLDERFAQAGIRNYRKRTIDLLQDTESVLGNEQFDGVILDAPCSGSGTWGRTPEQLSLFREGQVDEFSNLQRNIVSNVVKHVKKGSPLIYITCSVFKKENEDVVEYMEQELGLSVEKMTYLEGYKHQADTMFIARLIKR